MFEHDSPNPLKANIFKGRLAELLSFAFGQAGSVLPTEIQWRQSTIPLLNMTSQIPRQRCITSAGLSFKFSERGSRSGSSIVNRSPSGACCRKLSRVLGRLDRASCLPPRLNQPNSFPTSSDNLQLGFLLVLRCPASIASSDSLGKYSALATLTQRNRWPLSVALNSKLE